MQFLFVKALRALLGVPSERSLDGLEQILLRRVLCEEVFGALAHCAHRGCNVSGCAQKDDWAGMRPFGHCHLKVQTADAIHPQVYDHAAGSIGHLAEKLIRRRKRLHRVSRRAQEACDRHQKRRIVIDDRYDRPGFTHNAVLSTVGNVNRNVAPSVALFSAQMRPPCASIMVRETDSPIPMPLAFVVKNGSKMSPSSTEGIPGPVSLTITSTSRPPGYSARTAIMRFRLLAPSMASIALSTRFSRTCCR